MKLCECGCGLPAPIATATQQKYGWVKGQPKRFLPGHNRRHHRMSGTPEYVAYIDAKQRCTNPNTKSWKDYGARGIKFLFESFEQFLAELGLRPEGMSLDRKDNDSHYEPGNVRWATSEEQNGNRRKNKHAT